MYFITCLSFWPPRIPLGQGIWNVVNLVHLSTVIDALIYCTCRIVVMSLNQTLLLVLITERWCWVYILCHGAVSATIMQWVGQAASWSLLSPFIPQTPVSSSRAWLHREEEEGPPTSTAESNTITCSLWETEYKWVTAERKMFCTGRSVFSAPAPPLKLHSQTQMEKAKWSTIDTEKTINMYQRINCRSPDE